MEKESSNKNILLVDTDTDFLELVTICLCAGGYQIFQAVDGFTAVEKIKNNNFSCIITELLLPMMDGLRLLNWLRDEALLKIPVLVLTAVDRTDTEKKAKGAGATGIMFKPVNDIELLEAVNRLSMSSDITKTPNPPALDPLKRRGLQFFQDPVLPNPA